MFFKHLIPYRLPAPWAISLAALEAQLARGRFAPCPPSQPRSLGWVSPRDAYSAELVCAIGRHWLLALDIEERILPAKVVQDEVRKRAKTHEEQQGYAPGRKQLKELKERVTEELLAQAFTRRRRTWIWIDPQAGWFCVDAGSPSKAEEAIEHLRHCLDDFPVKLLHTQASPQSAMADWLAGGQAPAGFTIDRDCELKAVGEEKATVRYARHALDGAEIEAEIKAHLAAGKLPTKLALTWDERLSFMLTDKGELKRLAFLAILQEEAEKSAEHADEQFDADFAIMSGELALLLPAVVEALGGEATE